MFGIRFWGVRGSIACPGPKTAKYGGNTTCIQILTDHDYQIIVDLGTGARRLGKSLIMDDSVKKPLNINIFFTHTHWDHIMGFPFFVPIHIPTSNINIYGPVSFDESLEQIVGGQLTYKYFPVRIDELKSTINYHSLKEGELDLPGGLRVKFMYLNHPILCLGYRFEYEGKTIATCYDHEPFLNLFKGDPLNEDEGEIAALEQNNRVSNFYKDADILVHDAQYTEKEYVKFTGWGHSTFKYAVKQALKANVKKLILTHHDPERTDAQLDIIKKQTKNKLKKFDIDVFPAYEGLEIRL